MSQVNLVPTLRFSEFNAPWKLDKLGHYYTFKNGVNADREQYGKGTKFINVLDVLQPYPITSDSIQGKVEVDKKTLEKNAVVNGNLLFQRSSETREDVGTSNVYLGDRTVTFGGFVIRGTPVQQVNPIYMNYLLKSSKARKEIVTKSGGSTRYNVGQETLSSVNIIVSDIDDEQQKIADFLTSVDTKIGQLTEKHRLLKEYKKGLMQQIFSQQIRFKDENGNEFPDWKEKSFGSFLTLDLRKVEKPKDNFLALGVRSHAKGIFQKPSFDPSNIAMEELYVVREDDLVLSITFAWEGAIAIASKQDEGGLVSHRFPTYTFDKLQVIPEFFKYVVPSLRLKYLLGNISPGGAGRNRVLSKKDFIKLTWCLPSVKEQQKISKFLQSIDIKIEGVADQIEQTKQFKKGLLQQMFV
ncbi:restriction endonuclease subunit S [Photobacterium leiognathi]|uniref:restriction endonuclease subunit S n=1 Tax=Photobacterium leiognathi TaxID=553611 RepID=UPI000D15E069|nr:restriction endonuclease subunit S [Photobacterium leiognathi]PSW57087.1 restriction endonuclease subunit S [Photobacterium leiognathi subsp. mandapamensis]